MRYVRVGTAAAVAALMVVVGCSAVDSGSDNTQSPAAGQSEPPADADADTEVDEPSASAGDAGDSGNAAADTELEIAWIVSKATAEADNRAVDGFNAYIEDNQLPWSLNISDAKGSPATAADLLEDAVQRGVDAIVMSMVDLRASRGALDHANSAGIPVFTIDSGWTPGVVVDVTSNNYVMGGMINSYLADRLAGEGGVVALKENEHHGVRKRGAEFDLVMSENPGIKVLAMHNIDNSNFFADSQKAMEDFIARYGDEIDAVFAGWDEPAQAAAAAIEAAGLTDTFVVAIDGHPSAIEEIRKGGAFVATIAQAFEKMGEFAGDAIIDVVVNGENPDALFPVKTIYMDACLITQENLPEPGELPWTVCYND